MSFFTIEDYLILDKGSEGLKRQFEHHCNWCWYHGFGHCDICRKNFNKCYIPIRIREKQQELKLPVTKPMPINQYEEYKKMKLKAEEKLDKRKLKETRG